MPSTASERLLVEEQAAGENLNSWGDTKLNNALVMLETGSHGIATHTLTANLSLTYTNFTDTNGTKYAHKFLAASDGSYTVTLGGYERAYLIWNDSGYSQIIDCTGGGDSVTIADGEKVLIYCDATNVIRLNLNSIVGAFAVSGALTVGGAGSIGGALTVGGAIDGVPTPLSSETTKAANVQFVLDQAFAALNGDLPGQSGNALASLTTDGTTASWEQDIKVEVVSASQAVIVRRRPYKADLSGGAITLTLPASHSDGDFIRFITDENAATNTLTVARNGSNIMGLAEDMDVTTSNLEFTLRSDGTEWSISA